MDRVSQVLKGTRVIKETLVMMAKVSSDHRVIRAIKATRAIMEATAKQVIPL